MTDIKPQHIFCYFPLNATLIKRLPISKEHKLIRVKGHSCISLAKVNKSVMQWTVIPSASCNT